MLSCLDRYLTSASSSFASALEQAKMRDGDEESNLRLAAERAGASPCLCLLPVYLNAIQRNTIQYVQESQELNWRESCA